MTMAHEKNHDYHILNASIWPFLGALGGFILLFGSVLFFHDKGPAMMIVGLLLVLYVMYGWWSELLGKAGPVIISQLWIGSRAWCHNVYHI